MSTARVPRQGFPDTTFEKDFLGKIKSRVGMEGRPFHISQPDSLALAQLVLLCPLLSTQERHLLVDYGTF